MSDLTSPNALALAREAPALMERVRAGEMTVHAACLIAGLLDHPDPLKVIQHAWQKAGRDQRLAILSWLAEQGALP